MLFGTPSKQPLEAVSEEKENETQIVFTPICVGQAPPRTPRRAYKRQNSGLVDSAQRAKKPKVSAEQRAENSRLARELKAENSRLARELKAAARAQEDETNRLAIIKDIQSYLKSHKWTLYQFWSALMNTKDLQTSATVSRFLIEHGNDLLEDIARKRVDVAEEWAKECVKTMIEREGEALKKELAPPDNNSFSDTLDGFSLSDIESRAKSSAPTLWLCLKAACTGKASQEGQNERKDRNIVCISVISMLAHARSERANYFQSIMGFWMLASGASRSQFGVLNHAGFCVSYKTAVNHFNKLSQDRRIHLQDLVQRVPIMLVWDNLCLRFDVAEERLDNKSKFLNGTTALIIELHGIELGELQPDMLPLRLQRKPILNYSFEDMYPSPQQICRLEDAHTFHAINILFDFFPFLRTRFRDSHQQPIVERIPVHKTAHHSAPFISCDESSLAGTVEVINTLVRQTLKLDEAGLRRQGIIICNGDLLTWSLTDKVSATRRCDKFLLDNFSRWADKSMGLMHTRMSGARMVANEYWGKPNGRAQWSLWKVNTLLSRKPIVCGWKASKLAPFQQISELILKLALPANILDGFRLECGSDDLLTWANSVASYNEVKAVAQSVLARIASRTRVSDLRSMPDSSRDLIFENVCLFNHDALTLQELRSATREGDIGRIIDVLAHWMVEFRGTGSMPKYADALFETLYNLKHMHPTRRRAHLMNWLVNTSGRPGHFKEVDLLQEHENYYTKVIYAARGSNKSIEWLQKVTLCLWSLRRVLNRMNEEFKVPHNSNFHTSPDVSKDIQTLLFYLSSNNIQSYVTNRPDNEDAIEARDLLEAGASYANTSAAFKTFTADTRKAMFRHDDQPEAPESPENEDPEDEPREPEELDEGADVFRKAMQAYKGTITFEDLELDGMDIADAANVSLELSRCFTELSRPSD